MLLDNQPPDLLWHFNKHCTNISTAVKNTSSCDSLPLMMMKEPAPLASAPHTSLFHMPFAC